MIKSLTLAAAAVVAMGSAAGAIAAAPKETPPPAAAADGVARTTPGKETRYCVVDTLTGSRLPTKVCKTRKEWLAEGFDPLNP